MASNLAARFPHVDRSTIDALVHETHTELSASATVEDHLIALTQRRVVERLRVQEPPFANN